MDNVANTPEFYYQNAHWNGDAWPKRSLLSQPIMLILSEKYLYVAKLSRSFRGASITGSGLKGIMRLALFYLVIVDED